MCVLGTLQNQCSGVKSISGFELGNKRPASHRPEAGERRQPNQIGESPLRGDRGQLALLGCGWGCTLQEAGRGTTAAGSLEEARGHSGSGFLGRPAGFALGDFQGQPGAYVVNTPSSAFG